MARNVGTSTEHSGALHRRQCTNVGSSGAGTGGTVHKTESEWENWIVGAKVSGRYSRSSGAIEEKGGLALVPHL